MNYNKVKLKKKIEYLEHDLEYKKRVYPKCSSVKRLKSKIYYYNKKLASLCD